MHNCIRSSSAIDHSQLPRALSAWVSSSLLKTSLHISVYILDIRMGALDPYPVSLDGLIALGSWRCWCTSCEIDTFMGGLVIDLELFQDDVLTEEISIPVEQSQQMVTRSRTLGVSGAVFGSRIQFPHLSLRNCPARRANRFSRFDGLPQRSKAGSKRGLWHTNYTVVQHLSATKTAPRRRGFFRARGGTSFSRKGVNYEEEDNRPTTFKIIISINCIDRFPCICMSILEELLPNVLFLQTLRLANEVANLSIHDLPELQCRQLKEEHIPPSAKRRRAEVPREEAVPSGWDSLPFDVQDNILRRADFKDLFRCKALSKACKRHIESDAFCQSRGDTSEGSFTAISYYIRDNAWQCSGYDVESNTWRSLPTFSYLPAPDADLFKEFSVSGHRSLMCGHLSKLPAKGELVVFNPLTGTKRALPPLLYPRNPVLVHISVDSGEKSYTVVVAGSSSACDEHLSKKVEVFRSTTSKWTEAGDVPGPVFGLNEHQAGVSINGILYLIAFLEGSCHRGVVAFDVESGKWLEDRTWAIPFSLHSNTLQLVECSGKVHLFSEQERGACVEHCIDVLESALHSWRNVVRVKSFGGRGLQVYPEHTCVSFGEGKLCVFNTLSRVGVVYDMRDGKQVAALPPPPANQKGEKFFTLNPASFTLQPSFGSDPMTA